MQIQVEQPVLVPSPRLQLQKHFRAVHQRQCRQQTTLLLIPQPNWLQVRNKNGKIICNFFKLHLIKTQVRYAVLT